MAYTRKQYMSNPQPCTHQEYYQQFVTPALRGMVADFIGKERILASTDENLNDIPLKKWDALSTMVTLQVGHLIGAANNGGISLSDCVCTAKAAARMIQQEG